MQYKFKIYTLIQFRGARILEKRPCMNSQSISSKLRINAKNYFKKIKLYLVPFLEM